MKIFNLLNYKFHNILLRGIMIKGEPWFLASDVSEALGIRPCAIRNINDKYKRMFGIDSGIPGIELFWATGAGRKAKTKTFVNEAGLFGMIFLSKSEKSSDFNQWVAQTVLPSIRKNGGYIEGQENLPQGEREKLLEKIQILAEEVRELQESNAYLQKRRHELISEKKEIEARARKYRKENKCLAEYADIFESLYEDVKKEMESLKASPANRKAPSGNHKLPVPANRKSQPSVSRKMTVTTDKEGFVKAIDWQLGVA